MKSRQSHFAKGCAWRDQAGGLLSAITVSKTGTLLRRRQKAIKASSVEHFGCAFYKVR
jgi:hypothetical protein